MVYATASIAILSFIVWAHHMFTTGMPVTGQLFFMYATMLIAVPTGVKVFNWIATMWRGSMTFETPMLFAIGFIFVFTIGGFTGLMLAMAPIDIQLQDTYFVVAHFHYVLVAGSLFALFAGFYYWSPKWTGWMYNETRGKIHFWSSLIFFNVTFFPMHFLGLAGMPRRYADYPAQFTDFNQIASIGAFGFGLRRCTSCSRRAAGLPWRRRPKASDKPWDGAKAWNGPCRRRRRSTPSRTAARGISAVRPPLPAVQAGAAGAGPKFQRSFSEVPDEPESTRKTNARADSRGQQAARPHPARHRRRFLCGCRDQAVVAVHSLMQQRRSSEEVVVCRSRKRRRRSGVQRSMLVKLFVVAARCSAFGFALIPMYRAICQITGINNLVQRDVSARGEELAGRLRPHARWSSMRMRAARSVSSRSTASTCIRAS
jgi:hypothetical protein